MYISKIKFLLILTFFALFCTEKSFAVTTTCTAGTNWATATWSAGVPTAAMDAVINSGINLSITTIAVCGSLTIGNATNAVTTLTLGAGGSLDVNGTTGNLTLNPSAVGSAFTLACATRTVTIAGSVTYPTGAGTGTISVSTGTFTVAGLLTLATSDIFSFSGAGTANFNGGLTDAAGTFTASATCTVNIKGTYTVSSTTVTWTAGSTVAFTNNTTITPTTAITFSNVTLTTGTVTLAGNITVAGNWTNTAGILNGGATTVTFSGAAKTINGATITTFPGIRIPSGATITMNNSNTATSLTFNAAGANTSFSHGGSADLTISGAVTINQPTTNLRTVAWNINAGSATAGSVSFVGTNITATRIRQIAVTSGSLTVTGAFSYANATIPATQVITVSTGTITFNTALTMSSGTMTLTSTGTINFNGASTSFVFGGANLPVLTTFAGSTLNFAAGFTNNTTALILTVGSIAKFSGTGSITPTAAITFSDITLNSGTVTLAGNLSVAGNWINNGGALSGGIYSVTFSGLANTISGTTLTAFPGIIIPSGANMTMNNNNTATSMTFSAAGAASSFTHGGTSNLTISGAVTLNQPTVNAITSAWNINDGTSTTGSIAFVGTNTTASRVRNISVTTGSLTVTGAVSYANATGAANQVITLTTGTINFSSALTIASGTLAVTAAGTINFNGTAPSFTFGGANAPVFTTFSGCNLYFSSGFRNVTTALVLASGSNTIFTASGTITPSAAITFGNIDINASVTVTLGGNISLRNDWTNSGGTVTGNFIVSFTGPGTQTVTKAASTETFYSLTSNHAGTIALATGTNVTVVNALTLTNGVINVNGGIFTLGTSGVASTLTRTVSTTTNWFYGGTFKRFWLPSTAISSNAGAFYGLFPMGTSGTSSYRPFEINTTVNPGASAGYFTVNHTDVSSTTDLSPVYNDAGTNMLRIYNGQFNTAISGVTGGTYNISLTMTGLSNGTVTDLRLAKFTGGTTVSAVGTHAVATGTANNPTVNRTGITTLTDLNNDFRISTTNTGTTPIITYLYSRKATGNWSDATATGTWSGTPGGAGPACLCTPNSSNYVVISDGQTVTVDAAATASFIDIGNGATLNGSQTLTVTNDINTTGTGKFLPTAGVWTINRDINLVGTGGSGFSTASVIAGNLNVGTGTTLTISGAVALTVTKNLVINGILALGTGTLTMNGANGTTISNSGAGSITGSGTVSITTGNKTISAGTVLSIAPVFAITGTRSVTNDGTVTLTNNLTGSVANSTWINSTNAIANFGNAVLTTGTLNASTVPNTINYNGSGAQNIKTVTYHNLSVTKTLGSTGTFVGNTIVNNDFTVAAGIASLGAFSLSVDGISSISGTFNITSATGAKTFNDIIVNSTGTWNSTVVSIPVTVNGSIQNDGIFTANTGVYTLAGTAQTLSGVSTLAIPNATINGTYSNNGTLTISTALAGSGTLTQLAGQTLNIGGTSTITTLDASAGSNTVNYTAAGAQTIKVPSSSYYSLTLSGSGLKTLAGNTNLQGDLLISGTAQLDVSATLFSLDIQGNWNVTSTDLNPFVERTGTVTLSGGSSQSITTVLAGGETFNSLTLSGAGTKTLGSDITVVGNLLNSGSNFDVSGSNYGIAIKGNWTDNGNFLCSAGLVTFNGTSSQTIAGSGITTFYDLTINNTAGVSITSGFYFLTDAITLSNGTFNTGGFNFIMLSDASQTARIAPVTGTGAVIGDFTVQRYLSGIPSGTQDWAELSSPVVSSTMADWQNELFLTFPHTPPSIYSNVLAYNETNADYEGVTAATSLTPGQGFDVYLTDNASLTTFTSKTLTSVGVPNIGPIVIPINYTAANGPAYGSGIPNAYSGENLVGNPFASAINLSGITFGPGVLTTVDVWDRATSAFVTLTGGALIASHQAFWAYTTGGASGTITIPESAKSTNTTTGIRSTDEIEPFLKLTAASSSGSNTFAQTLKIACSPAANDGWDNMDFPFKQSPNPLTPIISSNTPGTLPLSISTFSSNHTDYVMPLTTNFGISDAYQISFEGISFVDNTYPCILLEDKFLNEFIDIHAVSNYVFLSNPNDNSDRFALHFSTNMANCNALTTNIGKPKVDFINQVQILQNESGNTINFNLAEPTKTKIIITNLLGQTINQLSATAFNQPVKVTLPADYRGMYIINVESSEGSLTKKFVKIK